MGYCDCVDTFMAGTGTKGCYIVEQLSPLVEACYRGGLDITDQSKQKFLRSKDDWLFRSCDLQGLWSYFSYTVLLLDISASKGRKSCYMGCTGHLKAVFASGVES